MAGTDHQDLIGMGTAFVCAPHLALTARHVVDGIFEKFAGCLPPDARGHLGFGVQFSLFDATFISRTSATRSGSSCCLNDDLIAFSLAP